MFPHSISIILAVSSLWLLPGCIEEPAPAPKQPASATKSLWREVNGAKVVGVDEAGDAALAAAVEQAKASAETARARWAAATAIERDRWAIKWAAPALNQEIEHVWVRPVNWSPFRIEGVLTSPLLKQLECGKGEGELVSFPIEELSDWIFYLDSSAANDRSSFEGGFTVKALESRYGRP